MATAPSTTVSKAFRVLDLFRRHQVLTTTLCADELDIPRPTAHRLLVSLREVGAVESTDHGHFRLSLSLFELGAQAPQRRSLGDRAAAAIEELADMVGLRVHLAVIHDLHLLYIETANGSFAQRVPTRVGNRGPLHATALGKVLLAHAPSDVVDSVMATELRAYTGNTTCDPSALHGELTKIRARGFATACEEYIMGMCSLATPITGNDGTVHAAISIAGSVVAVRPRSKALISALRRTAGIIEQGTAWEESYDALLRRAPRRGVPVTVCEPAAAAS